jgi:hypothetical protein
VHADSKNNAGDICFSHPNMKLFDKVKMWYLLKSEIDGKGEIPMERIVETIPSV